MQQKRRAWSELEAEAMYLLEHPDFLPKQNDLRSFNLVLRLWHYPSFEPFTVWLIYWHPKSANRFIDERSFLRQVVWNRPNEQAREFDSTEKAEGDSRSAPNFRIKIMELVREEIESRLAALQRISLPIFAKKQSFVIADGETFGMATGNWLLDAQIVWQSESEGWQEIIEWFNEMRAYLTTQLEKMEI